MALHCLGHGGTDHITSADMAMLYQGIVSETNAVLPEGNRFDMVISDANHILIKDGSATLQGFPINMNNGMTETLSVPSCSAGKHRYDNVSIKYHKDSGTGVESASLAVTSGTAVNTGTTPTAPAVVNGNILQGATDAEMVLYVIEVTANSITLKTDARMMASGISLLTPLVAEYDKYKRKSRARTELPVFGHITSASTELHLYIPCRFGFLESSELAPIITSFTGSVRVGSGGYVGASGFNFLTSGANIEYKYTETGMEIIAVMSGGWKNGSVTIVNNSAVAGIIWLAGTF